MRYRATAVRKAAMLSPDESVAEPGKIKKENNFYNRLITSMLTYDM